MISNRLLICALLFVGLFASPAVYAQCFPDGNGNLRCLVQRTRTVQRPFVNKTVVREGVVSFGRGFISSDDAGVVYEVSTPTQQYTAHAQEYGNKGFGIFNGNRLGMRGRMAKRRARRKDNRPRLSRHTRYEQQPRGYQRVGYRYGPSVHVGYATSYSNGSSGGIQSNGSSGGSVPITTQPKSNGSFGGATPSSGGTGEAADTGDSGDDSASLESDVNELQATVEALKQEFRLYRMKQTDDSFMKKLKGATNTDTAFADRVNLRWSVASSLAKQRPPVVRGIQLAMR